MRGHVQNPVQRSVKRELLHDLSADTGGVKADRLNSQSLQLVNGSAAAVVGNSHQGDADNGTVRLLQQGAGVLCHACSAGTGIGKDGTGHHVQPRKIGNRGQDNNIPQSDDRRKRLLSAGNRGGNDLREADRQKLHRGHGNGRILHAACRHHAVNSPLSVQRENFCAHCLGHQRHQLALCFFSKRFPFQSDGSKNLLARNVRTVGLPQADGHIHDERFHAVITQAACHKRRLLLLGIAA